MDNQNNSIMDLIYTYTIFKSREEYEEKIESLLSQRTHISTKDQNGCRLLHSFAECGYMYSAELFLRHKVHICLKDYCGQTPLHTAAKNECKEIVQSLKNEVNVVACKNIRTPVHFAARNGHHEVVQLLLERATIVDGKDWNGKTPLLFAPESDYNEVVQLLLEEGSTLDVKDWVRSAPLNLPAKTNEYNYIVRSLLEKYADTIVVKGCDYAGSYLGIGNNHNVIHLLFLKGKRIPITNEFSHTPVEFTGNNRLRRYFFNGNNRVMQIFLKEATRIVDADNERRRALHSVAGLRVVNYESTDTALPFVAEYDHREVVQSLLKNEATLNCEPIDKQIPQNLAVISKSKPKRQVHTCNDCSYTSNNFSNFKRHTLKHSKEKQFKCDKCSYQCAYETSLINHSRKHTHEKPFVCDICSFTCANKGSLKYHMSTHAEEKPFKCDKCQFTVNQKSDLDRHISMVHMNLKPFICHICHKAFNQKTTLNDHLLTHSKKKPFKCHVCRYVSTQKSNLTKHINQVHTSHVITSVLQNLP